MPNTKPSIVDAESLEVVQKLAAAKVIFGNALCLIK
jgi:dihydroorotase-like cyclic amidohydrolase